jgi:hypothetical protein
VPGDYLHIRLNIHDGETETEHVFIIPFMTQGKQAYLIVRGKGRRGRHQYAMR